MEGMTHLLFCRVWFPETEVLSNGSTHKGVPLWNIDEVATMEMRDGLGRRRLSANCHRSFRRAHKGEEEANESCLSRASLSKYGC